MSGFPLALIGFALLFWTLRYRLDGARHLMSLLRALKDSAAPETHPAGLVDATLNATACRYVRHRYASPYHPALRVFLADVWVVAGTLFFGLNFLSHFFGVTWMRPYLPILLALFLAGFLGYGVFLWAARKSAPYPAPTDAEMAAINALRSSDHGNTRVPPWWFLGDRAVLLRGILWILGASFTRIGILAGIAAILGVVLPGTTSQHLSLVIDALGITLFWTASLEARVRGSAWMGCSGDTNMSLPLWLTLQDMED